MERTILFQGEVMTTSFNIEKGIFRILCPKGDPVVERHPDGRWVGYRHTHLGPFTSMIQMEVDKAALLTLEEIYRLAVSFYN